MTHSKMLPNVCSLIARCQSVRRRLTGMIWLVMAAALLATTARSVHADTMSYSIDISSSLQLMEAPTNKSTQLQVSEQTALVDRVALNNPVVEITNMSTSADITNVQLTLNDPESTIEALKVLSADGTATGAFATNVYGGPATTIDIALATPLAPGQSVLWAMELAPVNGYTDTGWIPGYENILFPGSNPIPGTNASVQVTYTDPVTGTPTTSSDPLPNLTSFDAAVTVDPTSICSSTCSSTTGTPTTLYTYVPGTVPPPVPEPGSVVLMLVAGLPLVLLAWRKRRRAAFAAANAL